MYYVNFDLNKIQTIHKKIIIGNVLSKLLVREEMLQCIPYFQCLVLVLTIAGSFSIGQEQRLL